MEKQESSPILKQYQVVIYDFYDYFDETVPFGRVNTVAILRRFERKYSR